MGYVVLHRDAQGTWQVEDVGSLDAAVERVETLRNVEQRDEVRLFDEIALEVRTYYRVAVAGDRATSEAEVTSSPQPPAPSAPVPPVAAVEEASDTSEGPQGSADDLTVLDDPAAAREATPASQAAPPRWDPGSSSPGSDAEPAEGSGDEVDGWGETAAVAPPPGTFPLAAPPVPAAVAVDAEPDREASGVGGRRGSRFSRER